jgi:hypothetical protein
MMEGVVPAECWNARPTERNEIKEVVMAKVIEFYVPRNFRKPLKWAPQLQLGRVIEFCSLSKKSA